MQDSQAVRPRGNWGRNMTDYAVTPIGGILLIAGWVWLAWSGLHR